MLWLCRLTMLELNAKKKSCVDMVKILYSIAMYIHIYTYIHNTHNECRKNNKP